MLGKRTVRAVLLLLGVVTLCLISGVIGGAMSHHFGTSNYTISFADFIVVMLTAISVLMTLLAIFLAVVGVMGWNAITTSVGDRTERFLKAGFEEGETLYKMLQSEITAAMYQGVNPVGVDAEADDTAVVDETVQK